ncbi:MAG: phage holin family protein [Bacillota bacterium]
MRRFFYRVLVNLIALYLASVLVPSRVYVQTTEALLLASLVLALINAVVRPLVIILTLPINFLTLGLLTFVINGLMVYVASVLVAGFTIPGLFSAVVVSLIISAVNLVLSSITGR